MFLHSSVRVTFVNDVSDVELDSGVENPQERDSSLLLRHSRHGWENLLYPCSFPEKQPLSLGHRLVPNHCSKGPHPWAVKAASDDGTRGHLTQKCLLILRPSNVQRLSPTLRRRVGFKQSKV